MGETGHEEGGACVQESGSFGGSYAAEPSSGPPSLVSSSPGPFQLGCALKFHSALEKHWLAHLLTLISSYF